MNEVIQAYQNHHYKFLKKVFLETGLSQEKAHRAACLSAEVRETKDNNAILFALWKEAAEIGGDFYCDFSILYFHDADGWGFVILSPEYLDYEIFSSRYCDRSKARLEAKGRVLNDLVFDSICTLVSDLEKQGKITKAERQAFEESSCFQMLVKVTPTFAQVGD